MGVGAESFRRVARFRSPSLVLLPLWQLCPSASRQHRSAAAGGYAGRPGAYVSGCGGSQRTGSAPFLSLRQSSGWWRLVTLCTWRPVAVQVCTRASCLPKSGRPSTRLGGGGVGCGARSSAKNENGNARRSMPTSRAVLTHSPSVKTSGGGGAKKWHQSPSVARVGHRCAWGHGATMCQGPSRLPMSTLHTAL